MLTILGIDPGSRCTGYGVLSVEGQQYRYLASGAIQTVGNDMPTRLATIFTGLQQVIEEWSPEEIAIEQVFMKTNVQSALKLGQARGVALLAGALQHRIIAEYSPREVKQTMVGYGAATKSQMQYMVSQVLKVSEPIGNDAADALALAYCHARHRQQKALIRQALN